MESKVIELAKKLKALADRGIGGEKENAIMFLERLMQQHGITYSDIEGDAVKEHKIYYDKKHFDITRQIIASVIGKLSRANYSEFKYVQSNGKRAFGIVCTDAEYMLMEAKLNFYIKVYEDEMALFYSAFIQRNELYQKAGSTTQQQEPEVLSDEELLRLERLIRMMRAMPKHEMQGLLNK